MNKILSYKAHQSRLTQPRGLKYRNECWVGETYAVEAYAASWIEISKSLPILAIVVSRLKQPRGLKFSSYHRKGKSVSSRLTQPRGLKFQRMKRSFLRNPSRLTQPRGLKSIRNIYSMRLIGRGLRSLVDWNMDIK